MHAQPQRTLKRLIKQYGPDLVADPRRTEALLHDLCGQHRREIFVLVNAQKQRVPAELLAAPRWMPKQAVQARLSRQLQEKLALTEDAADWAVAAWAGALDVEAAPAKPGWHWPRRHAAPPSPAAPKRTSKKRQTASVDVQYRPASSRRARRAGQSPQPEAGLSGSLRAWPRFLHPLLTKWVAWGVVLALSAALLGLVAGSVFLTRMRAEPAASVPAGVTPEPGTVLVSPPPVAWETGATNPAAYLTTAFGLPRTAWVPGELSEGLNVRQEPSLAGRLLATLPARTGVTVDGFSEDGAWSHLADPNVGWVSNQFLSFLTDDAAKVMVVIDVRQVQAPAPLVVRALPNQEGDPVGEVSVGVPVVAVATTLDGQWRQIVRPLPGWVAAYELSTALE